MTNETTYYSACDWCGATIAYGNAMTSVSRQIEQIDRSEAHPDGVVTVIESESVLELCAGCGNRLPVEKLKATLRKSGAAGGMPKGILEALKSFLTENEISFGQRKGGDGFTFTILGENGQWPCLAVRMGDERFGFYSFSPVKTPEAKRAAMAEYLTRANTGLWTGSFEMDFDDGEVRFRTSGAAPAGKLPFELIEPIFYANVSIMDRYLPGILALIYSDTSPEQLIEEIEGEPAATAEGEEEILELREDGDE